MAGDKNMIVILTSAYLVVSAIRDLYDQSRGTGHKSTWFTSVMQFMLAFLLFAFARTGDNNNNNGYGNSGTKNLLRAFIVAILSAMFLSGVFMVVEGSASDPATEPNKKWFGTGHIIAASLLGAGYVFSMADINSGR